MVTTYFVQYEYTVQGLFFLFVPFGVFVLSTLRVKCAVAGENGDMKELNCEGFSLSL